MNDPGDDYFRAFNICSQCGAQLPETDWKAELGRLREALEEVREAKMPGQARVIAIRALHTPTLDDRTDGKRNG